MTIQRKEVLRQVAHLSGGLLVVVPHGVDYFQIGIWLLIIAGLTFLYSKFAERREAVRGDLPWPLEQLERIFFETVREHEREEEPVLKGVTTFALGIGTALIVFPAEVARLATLALAVGDAFATLIGVHWGRHSLPAILSEHRTWEGSLAGLVTITGVSLFYTTPLTALITGVTGSTIESWDAPVDDNIIVPLTVGAVLTALIVTGMSSPDFVF